jgi:hypothetical protein
MEKKGGEMILRFSEVGSLYEAQVAATIDDTEEQAAMVGNHLWMP